MEEAAKVLGRLGNGAVEPLLKHLDAKNPNLVRVAAEALGKIGDRRAVEPLLDRLINKNDFLNESVAIALGDLKEERAIAPLVAGLSKSYGDFSEDAAKALLKIGNKAVQPLLDAVDQPESRQRNAAMKALVLFDRKGRLSPEQRELVRAFSTGGRGRGTTKSAPEVILGGMREPYCSQSCHDEAGRYISAVMIGNQQGVCGFCRKKVRASLYSGQMRSHTLRGCEPVHLHGVYEKSRSPPAVVPEVAACARRSCAEHALANSSLSRIPHPLRAPCAAGTGDELSATRQSPRE